MFKGCSKVKSLDPIYIIKEKNFPLTTDDCIKYTYIVREFYVLFGKKNHRARVPFIECT